MSGTYPLKPGTDSSQARLPLEGLVDRAASASTSDINTLTSDAAPLDKNREKDRSTETEFPLPEIALMGIIAQLPTRYHPDRLAVSVGSERVGLAGWIVDRVVGRDADLDEDSAKLAIANLCERELVSITESRRLEATDKGKQIWQRLKSKSR